MIKRAVDVIERFERGDLSALAFVAMTILFTLGYMTYIAAWGVIVWLIYTGLRIAVGYPV
jgi:hypothetical protein